VLPSEKAEARLRLALNGAFGQGKGDLWTDDAGGPAAFSGLAGDAEMFPYVSFTLAVE
jgi:hypothetical protein